jgi:hypothetical protein
MDRNGLPVSEVHLEPWIAEFGVNASFSSKTRRRSLAKYPIVAQPVGLRLLHTSICAQPDDRGYGSNWRASEGDKLPAT